MKNHSYDRPSINEITNELKRVIKKEECSKIFKKSIGVLLVVTVFTITMFVFCLNLFTIKGESMSPTLNNGDYLLGIKTKNIKIGDIVAFEKDGKLLIKRVIATEGQVIDIAKDGIVVVDGIQKKEDYILDKSIGDIDIELPHKVEANSYFVMGDSRGNSTDSRLTSIGDVGSDQIIGKIIFRVWPMF